MKKISLCCAFIVLLAHVFAFGLGQTRYILTTHSPGSFVIAQGKTVASICVDKNDYPGVVRAASDLQVDIARVTAKSPKVANTPKGARVILIGTLGHSVVLDQLIKKHKIDPAAIVGKWESFLIQTVRQPLPGVDSALVIAGSDKRGTIYGIYDLSEQIGVSPWYWWADVPVAHKSAVFVKAGKYTEGEPSVKYRGIFLNDEAPDLTNWITEKFGTVPPSKDPPIPPFIANYGHLFYTRLFELILRLKGNYLWPAMWNNAFNEDDSQNPRLADLYGIVMGTSHQEPMLRAQKEWDRRYLKTLGSWNYAKNPDVLENFWREGIRRNKNYESILTMGLRGADDTPMAPGGPEANKALLEKIVDVQRKMIAEEINPDPSKVPQLWCLYKEVQDFYKAGMRVPDDVTLLWAEDNWGNVRRLPTADERKRSGGAGVYYHFDYHGGPRSYQWINTSPIPKIWDQLSLAKEYGADRIWIVNVGHFKGYEFPLEYFMNLAWDTKRWSNSNISEYTRMWAAREFGPAHAKDIASIAAKYTRYNGRRKPELVDANTYSLTNYQEFESVVSDFKAITDRAQSIYEKLEPEQRNAFYELVLFPTKASWQLNEMYLAAAKNALYARQGRASTNDMAEATREWFRNDASLMDAFNRRLANGKWNHFMDQSHIGYTGWRDPPRNTMEAIKLVQNKVPETPAMGVAVDGSDAAWPGAAGDPMLPRFDSISRRRHYIDVFNKGRRPFNFTAASNASWVMLSSASGAVEKDQRLWVNIDWGKAPAGTNSAEIKLTGASNSVTVKLQAFKPGEVTRDSLKGFAEENGYISIEAEHYTGRTDIDRNRWIKIEDFGHTLSGMKAVSPVDTPSATPGKDAALLEYRLYVFTPGTADLNMIVAPTLNFVPGRGLRYAVAFDDEPPQVVTIVPEDYSAQNGNADWEKSVMNNARFSHTSHKIATAGYHTLKVWSVDPGVVLQKIVVDLGGVKPSYLGPPESYYNSVAAR